MFMENKTKKIRNMFKNLKCNNNKVTGNIDDVLIFNNMGSKISLTYYKSKFSNDLYIKLYLGIYHLKKHDNIPILQLNFVNNELNYEIMVKLEPNEMAVIIAKICKRIKEQNYISIYELQQKSLIAKQNKYNFELERFKSDIIKAFKGE